MKNKRTNKDFLYFALHTLLPPILYTYALTVTGDRLRSDNLITLFIYAPALISEFLVLTNPLTRWVFYYDELISVYCAAG